MKIVENRPTAALRKASRSSQSAGGGGVAFTLAGEAGAPSASGVGGMGAMMAVGDIGMLLAVQGLDNQSEERRRAIRHGHDTLDALDSLKADLLAGRISGQKINRLMQLVEARRAQVDEPELLEVLNHIELRARVELAKLEPRR